MPKRDYSRTTVTITLEHKRWLKQHPEFTASGLLRKAINQVMNDMDKKENPNMKEIFD